MEGIFNFKNMKIVGIGDLHGNPIWKKIVEKEQDADLVIFVADYFDSVLDKEKNSVYSLLEQLHNFNEILEFKKANPTRVILLIGNHDHRYFPGTRDDGMSGFQGEAAAVDIGYILNKNRDYLQMAYAYDDILFTHAGVSKIWVEKIIEELSERFKIPRPEYTASELSDFVNDMWENLPRLFVYLAGTHGLDYDFDGCGDSRWQTPIWIRPKFLMKANKDIKKNLIQIVGHTAQDQIDIEGKATGSRYFFIDTINSNNEYLVIQEGKFTSKKI